LSINSTTHLVNSSDKYSFPKLNNSGNAEDTLLLDNTFDDDIDYFKSEGKASFYAKRFNGRKTASGERFSNKDFTAAHKTLPFGTIIRVKNTSNDKITFVRITDRGPFNRHRLVDISKRAADELGIDGVSKVEIDGVLLKKLPKTLAEADNNLNDLFLGYSLDKELIKTHRNFIGDIIENTNNFSKAVEAMNREENKENLYLFTKASNCPNCDIEYIVGRLITKKQKTSTEQNSAYRH